MSKYKDIFYQRLTTTKTWKHDNLSITKKDDNFLIKIDDVEITLPQKSFEKFKDPRQVSGSITYDKQTLTIPELKRFDSGQIQISIKNKKGKKATAKPFWVCHYNTDEWVGLKGFLIGLNELYFVASNPKKNEFSEYVTDVVGIQDGDTDHRFSNNYDKRNSNVLKRHIISYLKNSSQIMIVDDKKRLEKLLKISIPDNRVFDFSKETGVSWKDQEAIIKTNFNESDQRFIKMSILDPGNRSFSMTRWYYDLKISEKPITLTKIKNMFLLKQAK